MPLRFPPFSGQIVRCDYRGFVVPEMVKLRPVVVISPRRRDGYPLCCVVPLSTAMPAPIEEHHIPFNIPVELRIAGLQASCWAKCDMVNTVSLSRLSFYQLGKKADGKRIYSYHRVTDEQLEKIRKQVRRCMTGYY